MALIKCPECKYEISDKANKCPNCGMPKTKDNNIDKYRIYSKIGLLFVIIGFFMPISCNLNGFQIAKTLETFGGPNLLSISFYLIFICVLQLCRILHHVSAYFN